MASIEDRSPSIPARQNPYGLKGTLAPVAKPGLALLLPGQPARTR